MNRRVLLAIIALAGLNGCVDYHECDQKDHDRDYIDQPAVFEYEYINYAWGYRHHGFFIDDEGKIRGYRNPDDWKVPDSLGYIRMADLESNLEQCDTLYGRVGKTDLVYHYGLIPDAEPGRIKEHPLQMADAGTGTLYAYYKHPVSGRMERVFLACSGDVNRENDTSAARMIITWLRETGRDIDLFYWFETE